MPDRVLREAGFDLARKSKVTGELPPQGKSVSAKDIQRHVLRRDASAFTLADVAQSAGGSPMTVRKAVEELVRTGDLTRLGPTPGWPGPGRAPIQFAKS